MRRRSVMVVAAVVIAVIVIVMFLVLTDGGSRNATPRVVTVGIAHLRPRDVMPIGGRPRAKCAKDRVFVIRQLMNP